MNSRLPGHPHDTSPLPYQSLDSKGMLLDVNEAWLDRLGYERDEVVGRWFGELLTPQSRGLFQDRFDKSTRKGYIENVELQILRKDESSMSFRANGVVEWDGEGRFIRTHCLLNDATWRSQVERDLQQAKELADRMLELANAFVVRLNTEGTITLFNRYAEDLSGYSQAEVLGTNWFNTFGDGEISKSFRNAVASQSAVSVNTSTLRCKSGDKRLIEWRNSSLVDEEGRTSDFLSIGIDITERNRLDQDYRSLVDHSLQALAILQDQRIVFVNKAFEHLSGYTEPELLSLPAEKLIEIVHPDDRQRVWEKHVSRLESTVQPERYQWRLVGKNGQARWVETYASLIEYNGKPATQTVHLDITESRQRQLALEAERDRAQRYFDIAGAILIVLNADGEVEQINQTGCNVLCSDAKDIVGRDWFDTFIPEQDRDQKKKDYLRLMNGEMPAAGHYESIALSRGRGERLIAWNSSLLRDDEGNIIGTLTSGEDITERRLIERELRESGVRFRSLVDSSQDGIVLLDWRGMVTEWNQAQERITGLRKQDALLKPLWSIIHQVLPEEKKAGFQVQQIQSGLLALLRGESPEWLASPSPIEIERPDGERRIIESSVFAIRRGDRAQLGSITRDVTERERVRQQLVASESLFRSVFENASVGMAVGRASLPTSVTRDLDFNSAFLEMVGYEQGELGSIWDIVHSADAKEQIARFDALVNGSAGSYESEMRLIRKDENIIWVRVTASAAPSSDSESLVISIIVEDITSRKQAQDAAQQLSHELRSLGVRLAETQEEERRRIARELHDQISQNLTALSINITTVEAQLDETSPQSKQRLRASLGLIEETAERIRDLTFDLRPPVLDDFGLITAMKWHSDRVATQSGLSIRVLGDDPSPRLSPEAEIALFRVVQESLTNVVKHAHASNVIILLTQDLATVRLSIEDDGIGFDTADTSRHGGTPSWGLINMRERVEMLGGTFAIESVIGEGVHIAIEVLR